MFRPNIIFNADYFEPVRLIRKFSLVVEKDFEMLKILLCSLFFTLLENWLCDSQKKRFKISSKKDIITNLHVSISRRLGKQIRRLLSKT